MNENRVKSTRYSWILHNFRGGSEDLGLRKCGRLAFKRTGMRFSLSSGQNSKTFDTTHALLPLNVSKLTVRFFGPSCIYLFIYVFIYGNV